VIPLTILPLLVTGATAAPPVAARASAEGSSLVLIVASNRGAQLDRPPLQYADDDGVKYREVFAAIAGEDDTILLTDLDRDTARLFPALVGVVRSPTRANVQAAAQRLALRAAEARKAGREVHFYFVFAGHGDVERGQGFLELADGPFNANDLQALLRTIDATEAHVILDSCNSFFVVNPRKTGGRRFATPRDVAESLARRLSNVGVFLSTSAEAEVYEWSELQSGVFSHAVRSGLLGAADVNHDGRVTYQELAAFVETAAVDIKNPLFRPKVFARGPNGNDDSTLVAIPRAGRVVLTVDEPGAVRLAVRDRDGLRWADAFKEPGEVLELWLPRSLAGRLEVARLRTGAAEVSAIEALYLVPDDGAERVALASLPAIGSPAEPRGPGDVFRALFARPFGPRALAAYAEARARAPEPVFGIAREDAERMGLLLQQLAASERERRAVFGMAEVTAGSLAAISVAENLNRVDRRDRGWFAAGGFTIAAAAIGYGIHDFLRTSDGERVYALFRARMAEPDADQAQVVADTDARLHAMLQGESFRRQLQMVAGFALVLGGAEVLWSSADRSSSHTAEAKSARVLTGTLLAGLGAGVLFATVFSDTPTEKLIAIWAKDPGRGRMPNLSLAPIPGGGVLALSGAF
jgi:hypothetical protein